MPRKKATKKPMSAPKKHIGIKAIFAFILLFFILYFFTPTLTILGSFLPDNWTRTLVSGLYQEIALESEQTTLSEPKKYAPTNEFQVLGWNSGVCFKFQKEDISILETARHREPIAEIIVTTAEAQEYTLTDTTLNIGADENFVVCQKFGTRYSAVPEHITAIYIKPLTPITPTQISWVTAKDVR